MVRCPVCESTSVTIVLNSHSHGSCACCGATWIQEGSWQRAIKQAPSKPAGDVITLADRDERGRRQAGPAVAEEAVAT